MRKQSFVEWRRLSVPPPPNDINKIAVCILFNSYGPISPRERLMGPGKPEIHDTASHSLKSRLRRAAQNIRTRKRGTRLNSKHTVLHPPSFPFSEQSIAAAVRQVKPNVGNGTAPLHAQSPPYTNATAAAESDFLCSPACIVHIKELYSVRAIRLCLHVDFHSDFLYLFYYTSITLLPPLCCVGFMMDGWRGNKGLSVLPVRHSL